MVNITSGVAKLVGDAGITGVVWNPTSGGGSVFVDVVPPKPDVAVIATLLAGGYETAYGLTLDRSTTVQVRVRGKHAGGTASLATQIGELLWQTRDGATFTLADNTVVDVIQASVEGPVFMGIDTNERPEYVIRYTFRWSPADTP